MTDPALELVMRALVRERLRFESFTRPATELIVRDLANAQRILDLASGTGDPALGLAAARPDARVIASDRVAVFTRELALEAAARGLPNLHAIEADMHDLPLPPASVDHVTSRFGLQFAQDVRAVLREILRVLRAGGCTSHVVWGAPDQPLLRALLPQSPLAPQYEVDAPGPFQFARPRALARALEAAGFVDIEEQTHCADWSWQGDVRSFLQFMRDTSAAALDPRATEVGVEQLAAFQRASTLVIPVEVHHVRGSKP